MLEIAKFWNVKKSYVLFSFRKYSYKIYEKLHPMKMSRSTVHTACYLHMKYVYRVLEALSTCQRDILKEPMRLSGRREDSVFVTR